MVPQKSTLIHLNFRCFHALLQHQQLLTHDFQTGAELTIHHVANVAIQIYPGSSHLTSACALWRQQHKEPARSLASEEVVAGRSSQGEKDLTEEGQ